MTPQMHAAAVHALLRVETLPRAIWDPACGLGGIAAALRRAGHRVYASDLDCGCPDADSCVNFLTEPSAPFRVGAVVTAPPFASAGDLIAHALDINVPTVAALLPLRGLACARLATVLDGGMLARVYPLTNRPAPACSSSGRAWFVWDAAHRGRAEMQRIAWESTPCG
jgi:hypothetical protein